MVLHQLKIFVAVARHMHLARATFQMVNGWWSRGKITATVKEAALAAFDEVGGKAFFVHLATDDPKAFASILAKMIPNEVNLAGHDGRPL